jgi:hypothetical protein
MIDLQIFASADHCSSSIRDLNSALNDAEVIIHILWDIIHWNFQHHALVRLLGVHNMCTVLDRASATLLAAAESSYEKSRQ